VTYVFGCIPFLAGIAMIVLGVTMVRKAVPTAGYLFAVAGALELLAVCCSQGVNAYMRSEGGYGSGDVLTLSMILQTLESVLAIVLIAVAFALLAKGRPPSRVS
jgi:hypothetical protein